MVAIGPSFATATLCVDDDNDDCGAIDEVVREFLTMAGLGLVSWAHPIHPATAALAQPDSTSHSVALTLMVII